MADTSKETHKDTHSDPHPGGAPKPTVQQPAPPKVEAKQEPKPEAKPAPVKEAHMMSFDEFKASKRGQDVAKVAADGQAKDAQPEKVDRAVNSAVRTAHRDSVRVAFQRGDVVAPEILAKYPDAFDGTVELPATFIFGNVPVRVRNATVGEQIARNSSVNPTGAELYMWTSNIKGNPQGSLMAVTAEELVPIVSEHLKNAGA